MAPRRTAQTRSQPRGEEMRARIIRAAKAILSREGIEHASIREIANEAEVARGLVHYYFKTKEELLVAVAQEAAAGLGQTMSKVRAEAAGPEMAKAAFDLHRDRASTDPDWYGLRYDLFALALRKPAFRKEVAELLGSARRGIAAGLARANASRSVAQDEALAAILAACFDGLALQKLVDPAFDLDAAYRELQRLAAAAVESPKM